MLRSKLDMRIEARKRLEILKAKKIVKQLFEEDYIYKTIYGGLIYGLTDSDREMVRQIEGRRGVIVYHIIEEFADDGVNYEILYVDNDDAVWKKEKCALHHGKAFAYLCNKNDPVFGHFEMIDVERKGDGFARAT